MPIEWFLMLRQNKKDYGEYYVKTAMIEQEKYPIIKIFFGAPVLFGLAGIFSFTIQPLENMLLLAFRERLLGKTNIYKLFQRGDFPKVLIGRKLLVKESELYQYLEKYSGEIIGL